MAIGMATNTTAQTALRYLNQNNHMASSSLSKLSSGSRIVRASDDAAGLAVGTTLRADVAGLKQAEVNASHGISLLQVADGGLSQASDILIRMKTLTVQAQSGTIGSEERGFINKEFDALLTQLNDLSKQTKFSGERLIDGSLAAKVDTVTAGATDVTGLGGAAVVKNIEPGGSAPAGVYQLSIQDNTTTATPTGNDQATLVNTVTGISQTIDLGADAADYTGKLSFSQFDVMIDVDTLPTNADIAAGTTTQFTVENDALQFQVGIKADETIMVELMSVKTTDLGGDDVADAGGTLKARSLGDVEGDGSNVKASVTTRDNATMASNILDAAISRINEARAETGAYISRFEFAGNNLAVSVENLDAARSVLLDVDVAAEMANFSSKQVMMQASVSMLAQANQLPQNLLKLLG